MPRRQHKTQITELRKRGGDDNEELEKVGVEQELIKETRWDIFN